MLGTDKNKKQLSSEEMTVLDNLSGFVSRQVSKTLLSGRPDIQSTKSARGPYQFFHLRIQETCQGLTSGKLSKQDISSFMSADAALT